MNLNPAARRYADALFSLAKDKGALEAVKSNLQSIATLANDSEDFASFLGNPLLKPETQQGVIDAAFKGSADDQTLNFLHFLCSKERLGLLPDVCASFEESYLEEKGILNAFVVSAEALSEAQTTRMAEKLAAKTGKQIRIHARVDASLIGGFTIQVGDEITDFSVASQLERFKKQTLNA